MHFMRTHIPNICNKNLCPFENLYCWVGSNLFVSGTLADLARLDLTAIVMNILPFRRWKRCSSLNDIKCLVMIFSNSMAEPLASLIQFVKDPWKCYLTDCISRRMLNYCMSWATYLKQCTTVFSHNPNSFLGHRHLLLCIRSKYMQQLLLCCILCPPLRLQNRITVLYGWIKNSA